MTKKATSTLEKSPMVQLKGKKNAGKEETEWQQAQKIRSAAAEINRVGQKNGKKASNLPLAWRSASSRQQATIQRD